MFPLIEALKTPCIAIRVWAARALGRMGPAAAAAGPLLRKLCRSRSAAVRKAARQAIGQIESAGASGAPAPAGRWARFVNGLRAALGAVHS